MPNLLAISCRLCRGAAALLGAAALASTFCLAAETAMPSGHDDAAGEFHLRGYRGIRHTSQQVGEGSAAVAVHRLTFDDATHARWFVSKLYGDFTLSPGNTVKEVATLRGPADAVDLLGSGLILPLLAAEASEVIVAAGPAAGVVEQANRLAPAAPLRRKDLTHPLYLDKWDRYPLGSWHWLNDAERDDVLNTPDSLYQWMGRLKVTAQLNTGYLTQDLVTNDNLLTFFRKEAARHGMNYQRVEWLANQIDLYNRNPFLTTGPNSTLPTR